MLNDLAPSEPVELATTDAAIFTTTPPITSSAAGLFAETSESRLAFNHDSHRPLK
jgi:hypothetical protein